MLSSATDSDGQVLTATINTQGTKGVSSISGDNLTYTPNANQSGSDALIITISDGNEGAKDITITVSDIDTILPTILSVSPLNATTGVGLNNTVSVTFSESMGSSTVTTTTVSLKDSSESVVNITISDSGNTFTFTPSSNLSANTTYTTTLGTGIKDLAGNSLSSNYIWSFTTGDTLDVISPTVSSSNTPHNSTGVAIDQNISVSFSEPLDPTTINSTTYTLEGPNEVQVVGGVTYVDSTATFSPTDELDANTLYTATINTGVKDLAGNALTESYIFSFTTGDSPVITAVVPLGTAENFVVLSKSGITNVALSFVTGDIGTSPITSAAIDVTCGEMQGTSNIYGVDVAYTGSGDVTCYKGTSADKITVDNAVLDMGTAYSNAAGRASGVGEFLNPGAGTLTNQTLSAGTYTFNTAVSIPTDLTLTGGENDVWIFQINGTLDLASGKSIILSGGAKAKNIFWQTTGAVTLGTTSHFEGVILSQNSITMNTGSSINGRLLAQTSVALQKATTTEPTP